MDQPKTKKGQEESNKNTVNAGLLFSKARIKMTYFLNFLVISLAGIIGYALDKLLNTSKPIYLSLFIILSFPIVIFLVIKKSKHFVHTNK